MATLLTSDKFKQIQELRGLLKETLPPPLTKEIVSFSVKGNLLTLKVDPITKFQHDEIKIIWATSPAIRVKDIEALKSFIKRNIKKEVSYNLQELTKKEASTIITILRKM